MKTHFLISKLSIIIFLTLGLFSCNDDGDSNQKAADGEFRAEIDGVLFIGDIVGASIINGVIAISAEKADGENIILRVNGDREGNYTTNENSLHAGLYGELAGAINYTTSLSSQEGSIVIEDIDFDNKVISGSFEFEVVLSSDQTQSRQISNGSFSNIPFETDVSGGSGNTLTAKIDGTDWRASSAFGSSNFGRLVITGSSNNDDFVFLISVPADAPVGTEVLDGSFNFDYSLGLNKGSTITTASSGEVTITKHDTENRSIEGTFRFNSENAEKTVLYEVTEGVFSTVY